MITLLISILYMQMIMGASSDSVSKDSACEVQRVCSKIKLLTVRMMKRYSYDARRRYFVFGLRHALCFRYDDGDGVFRSSRYATQPELKSVPLKIITSMSVVPDKVRPCTEPR